jgi:23S rRNA maturation-related 3'-5' exoribonuclease YhaM
MKQLTEQQIIDNWNKLIQLVKDTFPEDYPNNRREKLLNMYHYFEERMSIAPASGKAAYHNAMVGGYVEHVLHVTDCALQIKKMWESNGAMINFTDEELIFAAMHHDLGKVGNLNQDYYIPHLPS